MDQVKFESISCPYCSEIVVPGLNRCTYCGSIIKKRHKMVVKAEKEKPKKKKNEAGNAMKVTVTAASSFLPFIGQIFGVIWAIVSLSSKSNDDNKAFGSALMISSIIIFIINCILALAIITTFSVL